MGDRANICVTETDGGEATKVYLYTHWDGSELAVKLKNALIRSKDDRWKDGPYLTRVIFCEMVKNDINGTTGYGISGYITDNEHDILYVDVDNQVVRTNECSYTFEDYIKLENNILRKLI
ncbi:MAG: hypothetical protein BWY47_00935 [Bacteroidetes bacterium ADurb.Bin302]|jgi:hypothetical protein|nr:MAG: hypothetical protein BWY47_00935 [Bacteroidetes bacterium ADurb.Bin302]